MTLPSSGPISFLDIQNEFGGSNPIGLDEYYRGGSYVPVGTAAGTGSSQTAPLTPVAPVQITTGGTIQLSMFRGTTAIVPFVLNVVISSLTEDFNMRSYALANGWDGTSPLNMSVTINTGVTVSSSSTSTPAFTTKTAGDPTFPVGSSLTLLNNGIIAGRGGAGGVGANVVNVTTLTNGGAGGVGGPALEALDAISITLNGVIGGGGGGGGGGGAAIYSTGGKDSVDSGLSGGGGGGGRSILSGGNGGAPGTVNTSTGSGIENAIIGGIGASGTVTAPGSGGVGPSSAGSGTTSAGSGGLGGDLGQPGAAGRTLTGSVGGAGGAAGAAVIGNSNITWAFGSSAGIYGSGGPTVVVPSGSGTWQAWNFASGFSATTVSSIITFYPGGTVLPLLSWYNSAPNYWVTPTGAGVGNDYWIKFTFISLDNGGATILGDALNTWMPLDISRSIGVQVSGSDNDATLTVTVQFATDSAGTNIVATHTGVTTNAIIFPAGA